MAVSLLLALSWFALCASPALAVTIWPTLTPNPGDTVGTTNLVEAEAVDDTFPIVSASLTINGSARSPLFITGLTTNDVYISFDPLQDGVLTPGPNHAVATVTNLNGDVSSQAWDFFVNTPPAITAFAPGNDALVTNTTSPTVSVTLSDPDDSTFTGQFASGRAFTVDGGSVASTYDAPTKTYSFKRTYSPLVWHTIVFSVKDAAGNPATQTWRFMIDTSADTAKPTLTGPVPTPGSTTGSKPAISITVGDNRPGNVVVGFTLDGVPVHSTTVSLPSQNATQLVTWTPASNLTSGTHTVSADATDAAGNTAVRQTWTFTSVNTLALTHTTSTDFTTCASCHDKVLTTEHENRGLDCNTCHGSSASARVQNAVADNDTACTACHDPEHETLHDGGLPSASSGGCTECHSSNISKEHESNCVGCHENPNARVTAAIAGGNAECGACHRPGLHPPGFYGFRKDYYYWTTTPGPGGRGTALGDIGDNATNPGAHANYLATTAKCGMCHSVHRATGTGTKLLPTADATCAGCHTGSTAVTAKIVTWTPYDVNWTPTLQPPSAVVTIGPLGSPEWLAATPKQRVSALTTESKAAAGGAANGGGPHNDSALDLLNDGVWDGTGATPEASYELGHRYGCFTRRCHATNPHGANSSKYKIFAAKLLFNESANADQEGDGTYGGLDAVWDDFGATDAAVERFVSANSSIMATTAGGDITITHVGTSTATPPDANETHALVAGVTCGRPSNPSTGEDECHAEASYAIVDKGIKEQRNHATGITGGSAYRTDNTGAEAAGYGGNDNRDWKTGHVAGTFAAVNAAASYAPIAGCTSCHDQTDAANTVEGNFTFPHGQVAVGASNLSTDGVTTLPAKASYDSTTGPGIRSRIWSGYSGGVGAVKVVTAGTNQKAYDGQCLKCHRSGTSGIGLTH